MRIVKHRRCVRHESKPVVGGRFDPSRARGSTKGLCMTMTSFVDAWRYSFGLSTHAAQQKWSPQRQTIALAILASLAPLVGRADTPFGAEKVISSTVANPVRILSADLDGDGDLDIVSLNNGDRTISWHENNAGFPTGFAPLVVIATLPDTAGAFAAADIDSDGRLDIVVGLNPSSQYVWLQNMGGSPPVLGPPLLVSAFADLPTSIDTADIDHDGDMDVVTASFADDAIAWHENRGGDPILWTTHLVTFDPDGRGGIFEGAANAPERVEARDVDGDGRLDIIVASTQDDKIQWFRNEPGTPLQFAPQLLISAQIDQAIFVTMDDVDGDGDLDALTASNGGALVQWLENRNGFGTQLPPHTISALSSPKWIDTGDIDHDGDIDAMVAAFTNNTLEWEENDGVNPPTFTSRTISNTTPGPILSILNDIDHDGDLDLSFVASTTQTIGWRQNQLIHRRVAFSADTVLPTPGAMVSAALAYDIDRDGDVDVISASASDGVVAITASRAADRLAGFSLPVMVASVAGASAISVGDVDNDGDPDIVVASESTGAITVLANNGATPPVFTAAIAGTIAGASNVALGDTDGDGDIDIVVGSMTTTALITLKNDGGQPPVFTPVTTSTTAGGSAVAIADLDHDGDLDILSVGGAGATVDVRWLQNAGGGLFTDRFISAPTQGPRAAVDIADVDTDGDLDFLAVFEGGSSVFLFENNGASPPIFTQRTIASGLAGVFPIKTADIDRDGDEDAVIGLTTGAGWLENLGGAPVGFTFRGVAGVPAAPRGLAIGDFDREGDIDLVIGAPGSSDLAPISNVGGQATLVGADVAPASVADGETAALLSVLALNEGRASDSTAHLQTLQFRVDLDTGAPMSQSVAASLFTAFDLRADNGDGVFNAADDPVIASEPTTTLPIVGGVFSLSTVLSANTMILPSDLRSVFLVATVNPAASTQGVAGFQVSHIAGDGNVIADAMTMSPLVLTAGTDAASSIVQFGTTPTPCPGDLTGDRMVGPADLLALLAGFGAPFGPADLLELLANFGATCP